MGESGSGKSVTSLGILGLHNRRNAKVSGEIWLDGEELVGASPGEVRQLRGKKMAMIFQDPLSAMHPFYTVGAQIIEAYRVHNDVSKAVARKHADRHARPGRHPAARAAGGRLPAPVLRRHAPARDDRDGDGCNPELLIADEPTTALDVTVQAQILDLMRDLQSEFNSALIIITHDLGVVAELADDILVMYGGKASSTAPAGTSSSARAPVHLGSARLDAAARPRPDRAAAPDQGHSALADQRPDGLRLPSSLRLHRAAAAAAAGARSRS